jgi:hypothetical protein
MTVLDRTGMPVGKVQSLAASTAGPLVVVEIDGRLVGLPQQTLQRQIVIVSTQTRAEMTAPPPGRGVEAR